MKLLIGGFVLWAMATGKWKTYLAFAQSAGAPPLNVSSLNPESNNATARQSVGNQTLKSILPSVAGVGAFGGAFPGAIGGNA